MRGVSVSSLLCALACSDNVEKCGGTSGYFSLYKISGRFKRVNKQKLYVFESINVSKLSIPCPNIMFD